MVISGNSIKFILSILAPDGLGLFIVKQLVNAHGGEINIKNNESGTGATITVLLPVAQTDI